MPPASNSVHVFNDKTAPSSLVTDPQSWLILDALILYELLLIISYIITVVKNQRVILWLHCLFKTLLLEWNSFGDPSDLQLMSLTSRWIPLSWYLMPHILCKVSLMICRVCICFIVCYQHFLSLGLKRNREVESCHVNGSQLAISQKFDILSITASLKDKSKNSFAHKWHI